MTRNHSIAKMFVAIGALAAFNVGCGTGGGPKPKVGSQKLGPGQADFKAGQDAAANQRWQQAADLFARSAKVAATKTRALMNQAMCLERGGDVKKAAAIYAELLTSNDASLEVVKAFVRVQSGLGSYKKARQELVRRLKISPSNASLLNLLSGVLRHLKKYDAATQSARKVILRDQKNFSAIKNLALIYTDQGKVQLAETFFRNALKLNSKDGTIYVNLGLIAAKRGEDQRAIAEFETALKLDPKNASAWANIGSISLKYRDYERAAKAYGLALGSGLNTCATMAAMGYSLEGTQKGQEAVAQLAKTYEMCPKEHELVFSMGMICMGQLRDNQCALKHFTSYAQAKKKLDKGHQVYEYIRSLKEQIEMEAQGPEDYPEEEAADDGAIGGEDSDTPSVQEASPAQEGAADATGTTSVNHGA
jgi:tetratricopeptide (TPR) repeat protein